jgi:signal transduction histidine kinase
LPSGSVVQFRDPGLWAEYRRSVLTVAGALILQALLIAWLLYERRARQRAEVDSRRNLALAADANRRETISALTSSIGHELAQPLSSIAHNVQALQSMVAADRRASDATEEILADIQAEASLAKQIIERHRTMLRSHQLHKKSIDLHSVIEESLALVAHDLRTRQIEMTLERPSIPCVIEGDPVLLAQVLVNLVRNAMDAMAEKAPSRRRIAIRSAVAGADVEVSVSDTGTGLSAEIIGTLFTPFVTTKPNGLGVGLVIAQRIVDAHGGTIAGRENADGGATFSVTLPRGAMPGRLPESLRRVDPSDGVLTNAVEG